MKLIKKYKDFELNIDILPANSNSLIVFSGVSGCGKTTALKELFANNHMNNKKVFMEANLNFQSSIKVKDLIALSKDKTFKSSYFDKLKINELLNTPVNKLSKGEQKRFYFYMCVSSKSDIYYFDDPFSSLDDNMVEIVKKIIEEHSTKHIVYVALHHDTFTCNKISYELNKGRIAKESNISNVTKENDETDGEILSVEKSNNKTFIKHGISVAINILIFTIIISFFSMILSGFNSVSSLKTSIDTLGIFNSQSGVFIKPNKVEIDEELIQSTYKTIAENENLEIIETYEFLQPMTLYVENSMYRMDDLYMCDNSISDGYYSSYNNPYLLSYFKRLHTDKTNYEILELIKEYDFKANPVVLNVSGELFDETFSKEIEVVGSTESSCFFLSNISVLDFYKSIDNNIYAVDNKEQITENNKVLIRSFALKSTNTSGDYLKYLSSKYNNFEFISDTSGNIVVSNNKNISIEKYLEYFQSNENILAYSFDQDMYCLKNVEFFKDNDFSYIGELKQTNNAIIASKNYILRYFDEKSLDKCIGKSITINNKSWTINCILDEVVDDNVYFSYDDYHKDIAPVYSYEVEVLIDDYANGESIVSSINKNDIGFKGELVITNRIDYSKHLVSLNQAKENVSDLKATFLIISILIILLSLVFSLILIIKSYILYATLDVLYIKSLKQKIIIILIACCLSITLILLTNTLLPTIINNVFFQDINNVLADLSINSNDIVIKYNWFYILLSFTILLIGELFNGRKINHWIKKIFKKV